MSNKTISNYHATAQKLLHRRANFLSSYPNPSVVASFLQETLSILFPHFCEQPIGDSNLLDNRLSSLASRGNAMLLPVTGPPSTPEKLTHAFIDFLPTLFDTLFEDATAICAGDPASKNSDEVILTYPGFYTIAVYRIAHWFTLQNVSLIPRLMTEIAHSKTGIDIHPGAKIESPFVIDHGTGIVIGESTEIRKNVKLYQGVTLGALSVDKSLTNTKRHPTIEENIIVYANATILGGDTVVGANSIIGGNVWLTESVPPHSVVYHDRKHTRSQKD